METLKRRILVVDDNVEYSNLVSLLLKTQGHETSIAFDGKTAIEKVLTENPELVILDLRLLDISGEEIIETVPKKSKKMLSKNLLETKSIIFSELFKV